MNHKKTIAITGASGLLGTFLVIKFLELGYTVKCHRNKSAIPIELESYNLEWIVGDIRDQWVIAELLENSDIIIHTAAMVSFDKSDDEKMNSINIEGTKLVVDNIIGTDIKLIHISSISTLGRVDGNVEIDEEVAFNEDVKNSAYAKSKHLAELEVHRGLAEGIDAMILLPSIILGKNNNNTSSSTLWDQILKFPKFAPSGANGFVDVKDVVSATVKCLANWNSGEKYIINGHNLEYIEIYKKVVKHTQKKVNPIKISSTFLLFLLPFVKFYFFLTKSNSKVSKATILTTSMSYEYNNSKSINELNMEYSSFEKSIESYCN